MENNKKWYYHWKRFIPIFIIIFIMLIAYFLGLNNYLDYELLKEKRDVISTFISNHPVSSVIIYMLIYVISTSLSIPGNTILSIIGGFLFHQPYATIYIVISATLGASIIFIAAKTAFRSFFEKKAGKFLIKMKNGFEQNKISYMFFLRLVPLFPFWLVNIAPAFFQVNLFTFAWTSFLGIIPGAFVFSQAGSGLDAVFQNGEELTFSNIFNWKIKIALIAVGILALIPVFIKKIKNKRKKNI